MSIDMSLFTQGPAPANSGLICLELTPTICNILAPYPQKDLVLITRWHNHTHSLTTEHSLCLWLQHSLVKKKKVVALHWNPSIYNIGRVK